MQEQRFKDRRIFGRISIDLPVRLKDSSDRRIPEVSCRNISAGGMGVISPQVLLPKTSLEICLDLRDKKEPLYLSGKVIWSEQIEKARWKAGICFDEPQLMSLWRIFK